MIFTTEVANTSKTKPGTFWRGTALKPTASVRACACVRVCMCVYVCSTFFYLFLLVLYVHKNRKAKGGIFYYTIARAYILVQTKIIEPPASTPFPSEQECRDRDVMFKPAPAAPLHKRSPPTRSRNYFHLPSERKHEMVFFPFWALVDLSKTTSGADGVSTLRAPVTASGAER